MREIRFRAWNKAEKRMGTVISISFLGENSIGAVVGYDNGEISFETEDTVVLIQYTGLEDSNGKKVYEGDIIRFRDGFKWYYGIAEYNEERLAFCIRLEKTASGDVDIYLLFTISDFNIEIIGNIYEGAEPLEEE